MNIVCRATAIVVEGTIWKHVVMLKFIKSLRKKLSSRAMNHFNATYIVFKALRIVS